MGKGKIKISEIEGEMKMNKNYEMKKNNAASVLTDEIVDIFGKINKAMALMQEVTDDYFNRLNPSDEEDRTEIAMGFRRSRLYASVVEDYVFEAKQAVLDLVARSQNSIEETDEI